MGVIKGFSPEISGEQEPPTTGDFDVFGPDGAKYPEVG
jgi:hypothetical protein